MSFNILMALIAVCSIFYATIKGVANRAEDGRRQQRDMLETMYRGLITELTEIQNKQDSLISEIEDLKNEVRNITPPSDYRS